MFFVMCYFTSSVRGLRPLLFSYVLATLYSLNHQFKIWSDPLTTFESTIDWHWWVQEVFQLARSQHSSCLELRNLLHTGFAAIPFLLHYRDSICTQSSFQDFITFSHYLIKLNRLTDPLLSPINLLSPLGRNHHLWHGLWLFFYAGFAAVLFLLHPSDSWCTQTSFEDLIIFSHYLWKYYR